MLVVLLFIFAIVANGLVGAAVYFRASHQIANKKFALLSFVITFWLVTQLLSYISTNTLFLVTMQRFHFFISAFIPFLLFEFILAFPKRFISFPKWFEIVFILVTLIFSASALSPFVIQTIIPSVPIRTVVQGLLYYPFVLFIIFSSCVSLLTLLKKLLRSAGNIRIQLQYLLFSFSSLIIISIAGRALVQHFALQIGRGVAEPLATIISVTFLFYAMERHRFMDINRIAASVGRYLGAIIALGVLYFFIGYGLGKIFFPKYVNIPYIAVGVFLILTVKYTLTPLRSYFWYITKKFFYGNLYDREAFFQSTSKAAELSINLRLLVQRILINFREELMVKKAIYVKIDRGEIVSLYLEPKRKVFSTFTEKEIETLENTNTLLFVDDIFDDSVRKLFFKKRIAFIIPLTSKKTEKSFLLLGEKISGAEFSLYDKTTIKLILPTILIALQNAQHVEEIKQFNVRLKKEISSSTKEIRKVNTQLRHADKLKDEFISIASHELKTPTTAIQGFLWLVLQKDKKLSDYSRGKIERVAKLTEHMTTLVNDMLDVSKIESKRISLHPETFDLNYLIEEIKGELDLLAVQKKLQISIDTRKPHLVWADRQRMHQVVSNLVNNAIKYTKEGGRIKVTLSGKDSIVRVSIADNGIGIRESDMPKLFTKFGKLDDGNSISSHLPGTGLGLYITKNLVELSGGNISVISHYGYGSTFSFTVPTKEKTS